MGKQERKVMTIVGGGSSAHVLIPFLSGAGHSVNLLTRKPQEWLQDVTLEKHDMHDEVEQKFQGRLDKISSDPAEVIPQADLIVLCMPVSSYRESLHHLAPHVPKDKDVYIGAIYGQGGFNWMVEEIKKKHGLSKVITFAVGLIPWICRTIEYGKAGVTYGCKPVNLAAVSPADKFNDLNDLFLDPCCRQWLNKGPFTQVGNFLSLTLSVDNQIIHPSRCYGLFVKDGGKWAKKEDIPYFYRDFDQKSADVMKVLDNDYSKVRNAIKAKYPQKDHKWMLDYLEQERKTNLSDYTDILKSLTCSLTLGAVKPPVVQRESGEWVLNTKHRFFTDDIRYGLCIVKWLAEQFGLETPAIDDIIGWAQDVTGEKLLKDHKLILGGKETISEFFSGIPPAYGLNTIDAVVSE